MADDALLEQEQTLRTRLGRKLVEEAVAVGVGQRRQVQRDKDGRTQRIRLVPKKKTNKNAAVNKKKFHDNGFPDALSEDSLLREPEQP